MCIKSREIWASSSAAPLGNCNAALLPVKGITNAEKTLGNTTYTSLSARCTGVPL